MRNVRMLATEPNFMAIPAEQAIYCENCNQVSNSTWQRCGACGSEAIFRLKTLLDGPPSGPESGPASACCVSSTSFIAVARAV